jgi:hypothetical protein
MDSVWMPAESKLGWKGFADGTKVLQPGAVPYQQSSNKYAAFAAKAIGEMAYSGFENWMDKKKDKEAAKELLEQEAYNTQITNADANDGFAFDNSIVPPIKTDETPKEVPYVFDEKTADIGKKYKVTKDGKPKEAYWYVPESNLYQNDKLGNLPAPYWAYRDYTQPVVKTNEGQLGSIYTIDGIQYQDGKPITQEKVLGDIYTIDGLQYRDGIRIN